MSTLNDLEEKIQEIEKQIKRDGEQIMKELFIELFNELPKVQAVRWAQYTPYFNDGDPCIFNVYEPEFKVDAPEIDSGERYHDDDYDDEDSGYQYGDSDYPWITPWYNGIHENPEWEGLKIFNNALCSNTMERVCLAIFGDHSEVVATRDGFDVTEYYHE